MPGQLAALLLQQKTEIWDLVLHGSALANVVLVILLLFSLYSWTIVFAKWSSFSSAKQSNLRFIRAFRKAQGLDSMALASEQFRPAPLVNVFALGHEEVMRQMRLRGNIVNRDSIMRTLQVSTNEELARMENGLGWLATTASVSPFIGLFGTVLGIIRAFQNLGAAGSTSLMGVGPGISEALVATAVGLAAAIPASIFYNLFGHQLKELGERMDDFGLEFLNMVDRGLGE